MANNEKISEIIDESAFKQLERLLKDLGLAQKEFIDLTKVVTDFNNEISKSKSMGDLSKSANDVANATAKVAKAQENQAKTAAKVVEVEKEIIAAAKQKILVNIQDDNVLRKVQGSLDEQIKRQLQLKVELNQVKDAQKDLNKQVASSPQSIQRLNARMAELAKQEALLKNAIQQNNLEIRRSVREQNAAEDSSDALAARLDQLRGAFRSLNKEERENAEVGGVLLAQIQALDEEVKAIDASLGVHNRNVGNYASALAGLGGPIGSVVGNFTALVDIADDINENLENSPNAFQSFTDGLKSITRAAWAFITTPLGATIAAITLALQGAKAWYDYNAGLVEATRLTKQLTGLGGDDLKSFRTEVQATANVFDKEFKEVLLATNSVSQQFGIGFEDSLELIRKGFIAGADANGEFLDQLREYPTQLQSVGLSAEETIAIITQNVKDGIFSDKGIDAIKEAGLRIREMPKSTSEALKGIGLSGEEIQKQLAEGTTTVFEVIQQVSRKLNELPSQSSQVGAAIADIFGGAGEDAGLAYLKTLADINTNLDETAKKAGAVGEAQQKQLEATEKLDKAFAALFDTTGGGFELLIANTKLWATEFAIGVLENIIKGINYFVDFYNRSIEVRASVQAIGVAFSTAFNITKAFFQLLFDGTKTFAQLVKAVFTGSFDDIGGLLVAAGKRQMTIAKNAGKNIGESVVEGFNETVFGRLDPISIGLNTTGAANASSGVRGNITGSYRPTGGNSSADKKAQNQAKKRLEAELALATYRATVLADIAKKEAQSTALSYDERIMASERWVEQQEKVLAAERDQALAAAEFPAERIKAEEEYTNKLAELKKEQGAIVGKAFEDEFANIQRTYSEQDRLRSEQVAKDIQAIRDTQAAEEKALADRFINGDITQQEFQQRRLDIQSKYSQQYIQQEIKESERLIEINKARGIDTASEEQKLANLKAKLSKETTDKQIADAERLLEREKEINEKRNELGQELANLATTLVNARFENEISKIDEQIEALDRQTQAQINAINQEAISEEEKTIKIAQVEAKAQQQREQLEARQRQVQQRQARFDRAVNIAGIIGNTARGVTAALAMFPPNVPLSILIGAIGAAQIATVLATPLPRFFTGTESSPEGFAHVGEKGRELMVTPSGELMLTPNRDTVTYLQEGTQIFNAHKTKQILAGNSVSGIKENGTFITNNNFDASVIVKATKESAREIKETIRKSSGKGTIVTKSGFREYGYGSGKKWSDYLKRNIK